MLILKKIDKTLRYLPIPLLFLLSTTLVLLFFVGQISRCPIRSIYIFYALPIFLSAWYGGAGPGIFIAVLSGLSWSTADAVSSNFHDPSALVVDSILRLGFFIIVAYFIAIYHDLYIREKKQARHDALTGLLNIRGFYELAPRELERCRRFEQQFSVILLDVDDFKNINDTMGHLEGNRLLKRLAFLLKSEVRSTDLVARIGGDEFIIILAPSTPETAKRVVKRILQKAQKVFELNNWPAGLSAGVITFMKCPDDLKTLILVADEAMYAAKMAGKRQYVAKIYGPTASHKEPAGASKSER